MAMARYAEAGFHLRSADYRTHIPVEALGETQMLFVNEPRMPPTSVSKLARQVGRLHS